MASRKSSKNSKNNTIYLIVFLLLLLLAGWLLWKVMSPAPARQSAAPQAAFTPTPAPASYPAAPAAAYAPIPTVSFTMPPAPAPQASKPQPDPAPSIQQPAQQAQQNVARPETTRRASAAPKAGTTARRSSSTAAARPSVAETATPASSTLSAPTRPTRPSAPSADITGSVSGSPIQGMAIVRNKYYDPSSGRHYLFCVSDKTSLTYTYEVDAATYNEANIGLMYNPAKVAGWKFVSSQ